MADTYIDVFETAIYGKLATQEMRTRVMPLHASWASAVERGIALQDAANARMEAIIGQMTDFRVDPREIEEVTDTIVRFGAWIDSLKGRPLDPVLFFSGAVPSTVARRRLSKLTGHLEHMITQLTPFAEGEESRRIEGAASRLAELRAAHAIAMRNRDAQRAASETQKTLAPEAEQARQTWLSTYVANKRLIEGILRHHGLETFMPLIFDDLAETQRTKAAPGAPDPLVDGPAAPGEGGPTPGE